MSRSKSGLCLKTTATTAAALVSPLSGAQRGASGSGPRAGSGVGGVPRSTTCLDLKSAVRAGRGIR